MKIGIIGTGSVGAPLAKHLAAAGHQVKVTNTRPPEELARKAQELGASPATLEGVVQDVDVLFISIPLNAIAKLPKDLLKEVPAEVVVVDTSNYYPFRDGKNPFHNGKNPFRDGEIEALEQDQTESEWVAEQLGRPIVKAYNNLLAKTIASGGTAPGTPGRLAMSIAGDDARAKQIVTTLGNDTGFDVVDGGTLAESWRQQPGTPAYCTELTAPELTQALAAAVPGKAPAIRDAIMARLSQSETPPTHEQILALNRSVKLGAA